MEQLFEFSGFKWVAMFVVFILVRLLGANKSKKVETCEEQEPEGAKSIEEILGEIFESHDEAEEMPAQTRILTREEAKVEKPKKVKNKSKIKPNLSAVKSGSIADNEISDPHELIEDFDLQKAVIMTEILKRKYDE